MFLCTSYRHSYSVSNETLMTPSIVIRCRGVQAWYDSRDLGGGDIGGIAEERRCEHAWNGAQTDPGDPWAQPASGQLKRCRPGSWAKMGLEVKDSLSNVC